MFKIRQTEETVNRTFRIPKSLLDKMAEISQNEGVSLNSFVVQCCEYAIGDMKKTTDKTNNDK